MLKWLKKIRQSFIRDLAIETLRQLEYRRGWSEFLPPVALHDAIYLTTKDGKIYRMSRDFSGLEIITQISRL